jgi:hypothetical protein
MPDYDCVASIVHKKWKDGWNDVTHKYPDNANILFFRPYSVHPDDWYLTVVMAELPNNDITPYVTWLCNTSFGETRFIEGHYFPNKWEAFEDWKTR